MAFARCCAGGRFLEGNRGDIAGVQNGRHRARGEGGATGDVALSPLELNEQNLLRRKSARPMHLRGPDYEEKFDSLTVSYDCFRSADCRSTIMLGPPLFNLSIRSCVLCAAPVEYHGFHASLCGGSTGIRNYALDRSTTWTYRPAFSNGSACSFNQIYPTASSFLAVRQFSTGWIL